MEYEVTDLMSLAITNKKNFIQKVTTLFFLDGITILTSDAVAKKYSSSTNIELSINDTIITFMFSSNLHE